ncbi:hypothetical protein P4284_13700 [Bacillus swezeyi]|nr:hypothetical protein [Bacillus swezeyi]MED3080953.1 hypothetical protein [Bacillus swezeyi]
MNIQQIHVWKMVIGFFVFQGIHKSIFKIEGGIGALEDGWQPFGNVSDD